MNIAVASGKGGTGKTTVSVSLALFLAGEGRAVSVIDCDVEEPNVNLFLGATIGRTDEFSVLVPSVDNAACNGCGKCEQLCAYSAIVLIKDKPLVMPDLCHSCGGCELVCPERAITEAAKRTGIIETGEAGGIAFAGGRLDIGEHMSPPLIKAVKHYACRSDIRIIDCPPGTSCPVVESARGCDFLVLVTEPTPFGLNDLRLAVEMARALGLPHGVVINRAGSGDSGVDDYCAESGVSVIARIPYDRRIAEEYSRGDCASRIIATYGNEFSAMMKRITETTRKGARI
ncbi:MAG TPA: ATP-binding protein [Spirochaetota bacterium]|nr:ATP-binding protein [Spirochaetota bacterium]